MGRKIAGGGRLGRKGGQARRNHDPYEKSFGKYVEVPLVLKVFQARDMQDRSSELESNVVWRVARG